MTKVLFICYGNICRSPMAQCVFTQMLQKENLLSGFTVDSAATSAEELGNPIYPPARAKLLEKGVPLLPHRAVQLHKRDYEKWDHILCMESRNVRDVLRITGGDPAGKVCRLTDFTDHPRDVADPWYTGDFEASYRDIVDGCRAFLRALQE